MSALELQKGSYLQACLFFFFKSIKYFSLWLEKIRKGKKPITGSLNSAIPHTIIMNRHSVSVADKLGHMMAGEM